ncbi:putative protein FAM208B [Triplophysa rosa]|uniref:DUF3715 domain-containing protein n=1 Tax=Triplophysa rosa TaxID=992332 RepID=A0A9W7TL25_TRIRA|nr:putative protein FAM208B [Triplophysa rosa]
MDNATTQSKEALLEPVLPGSVTFNENILAPLQNNYLYKESKECFTYKSAILIKNAALQKRYAAFRAEKGYSEQELEESYGFLLFDDIDKAKKVGETGLLVGQPKCTTLGDSSKGVYISKYSDCLDLKRWYNGKTGYIVLVKLTKGRVKEVTDNYTQNFTPPTPGFDCHVSEQLGAVTSTTSSFLAYERTQYYLYELVGSGKIESCPRQTCPLAIVAFSYGETAANSGLEEQSSFTVVFRYKPWIGQLKIESTVYDVGLQSVSGAWFPAKLPKMVKIDRAIGVSELKRTLPREIFETCLVGEVCIDGRCFNVYDVVSSKAKNDLAQITQELKEKDMALVIPLDDSGFLILLHSSHLFSYEDARSGKAAVLQGMFIFPDSRTVPRDTKCALPKNTVSADIIQAIPAINYAETEMGKCPPNQQGALHTTLEKHMQNYATLIQPGLLDAPTREASMFPDQYDMPSGFTLISPKWSQETGTRLKSYFEEPCGFTVPVVRALELLAAGRQQHGDEQDDDVYYYISSPEQVGAMEVTKQAEAFGDGQSTSGMALEKNEKDKNLSAEQPQPALQEGLGTMRTAVVTLANSDPEYPTSTVSPKLGDVSTENCVSVGTDAKKFQGCNATAVGLTTKEEGGTAVSGGLEDNIHPENTMTDNKVDWRSRPKRSGRKRKMHWKALRIKKEVQKELTLPTSSLALILPANSTESMMDRKEKPKSDSPTANDINQRPHSSSRGRGHRRRGVSRNLSATRKEEAPLESTAVSTSMPAESIHDHDEKIDPGSPKKLDWRSLPRRKRLWNTDGNLKRCLRSDAIKTCSNDSISEENFSRGPKRKIEGFCLKDRYGLKNIITTCGRVFVPHGSDGDVESSNMCVETSIDTNAEVISPVENKSTQIVESSEVSPSKVPVVNEGQVTSESPSKDKLTVQIVQPITTVGKHNKISPSEIDKSQQPTTSALNEAESLQDPNQDHTITAQADETTSPPRVSDQSTSTFPKVASPEKTKKKEKRPVYSAISISKLKTLLRRGKLSKSPSSGGDGISQPEQESKKERSKNIMDNDSKKQLKDKGLQSVSNEEQHFLFSHGSQEPMTILPVAWKGLIPKASNENGPPNFRTSVPFKIFKQADEQLTSSLIGEGVGRISSHAKGSTEKLTVSATLPSDALSLLADLALGASNNKMLIDLAAKPGPETPVGVKAGGSPESVLHALLQCPSTRFKLPPRSPFPEGLMVTGELLLEISKEHSYSQPTSLLSGLSGTCPQVCSPSVESSLSLETGLHLNLPVDTAIPFSQKEGVETEWKSMIPPNGALASNSKTKLRRSNIFQNRHVFEKKGSIQVMRIWRETYKFKYDSKFTNDSLDKTVMRALHGKWNFDIEGTPEEVHLIFHMWIGLFYSKSASRLFHLENSAALSKEKDNVDGKDKQDVDLMQTPVSSLNVNLNLEEDSPKALHLHSGILDLSVKNCEPVNLHLGLQQSKGDDTVLHPGVGSQEIAQKNSPSGPSSPKVTAFMDHRSAVDILVENVASDKDNCIDDENDIIADCSYTQLLEGNSAYSRLCEQASHIRISMQPQMRVQKVAHIYKNVTPMKTASLSPKDIGVFHQVIKPSAFSKCYGLVLNRKSFDLCLKDKTGNAVAVVQKEKDMSKNAESNACYKGQGTQDGPVSVGGENVDKTLEPTNAARSPASLQKESVSETKRSKEDSQTDEDSQDEGMTIVEEENVTFKSLSQDESSVTEHEIHHADLHDHTDKCDSHVDELKHELVEEQNETINAREDDPNVVNASPSSVQETDTEEPVEETAERCAVEDEMQEGQSKSEERNEQYGSDSERKTFTSAAEHPDELAVDLMDNTDYVDMEISDDESDANAAIDAHELNIPSVKSFVSETVNSDVRMEKSETQTEQPEEANPGDDAHDEIEDVSHSGDVTSSCQLMSVEEKTTSASNNDTVDVMQSGSENVTLEQNIEVQEAHELCESEPKPTHDTEANKLEVSQEHKEDDVEKDNDSQISYSCEDEAQDTHQKYQSPKICASSPNSTTTTCEETVAPQPLKIKLNCKINSTCCTPTQDEVSYDPEVSENFNDLKEASNNIDHDITERSSVSPRSHVHTKMSFSDFVEQCEETPSEEPGWRKSTYKSPGEKPDIRFKDKLCPVSQQKDEQAVITESASQHDSELSYRDYDVDETHRSYHPSDEHLPWSYHETDGSDSHHFDEYYQFDEDDFSYPVYNPEDSYKAKMTEMGHFCWTKKNYKSESALDDANRRGDRVRCRTKMTYVPHNATDNLELEQIPEKRSRTDKFTACQSTEWNEEDSLSCTVDYSNRKTSYRTTKPTRTVTVNSLSDSKKGRQRFDWRRYFRRVSTWDDSDSEERNKFDIPPSSIVTVLDKKGSRVTFNNSPAVKPAVDSNRMTTKPEDSSNNCQDRQNKVDLIQSALDLEYLIFSERLDCILKEGRSSLRSLRRRSDTEHGTFPMTVRYSNVNVESSNDVEKPSLTELKIKVDLSDRKGRKRKRKRFYETGSETTEHESWMNDVWTDRTVPRQTEAMKKKWDQDSQQPGFSGNLRKDAFDNLHDNLSFTVKQKCKVKYRFYILITSADTFFKETRNLLLMEGHIPVEPDEFDLSDSSQTPLLIVLRNEDIAEHIGEVPYLLELKKSSNVLFAGIDRPDDVVNFTHHELFANGGFIVCDELALDTLTLDNMKKVVGILEELDKKGKWKWFLHYKDSRKLRESARSSQEASKKQRIIDFCQEAGIVEILPYHECDVTSQGQPDYLFCLTNLQIQNESVRFPVFITDTSSDAFEENGILTMDIYTFSRILSEDTCYVS